jgi:hypothetical protein
MNLGTLRAGTCGEGLGKASPNGQGLLLAKLKLGESCLERTLFI